MKVKDLGLIDYKTAWDLQKDMVEKVKSGEEDLLLLCEHKHVYTFGKSANHNHLLVNDAFLKSIGAQKFNIERGGDITYHGPGQLVGYPILDLNRLGIGVRKYVDLLEDALIETLQSFNIQTKRIDGLTGIWLKSGPPRKIAAIGIKISRGVSMHGFALNITTDLSYFQHMVPCGIADKDVTSIEKELGSAVDIQEVKDRFVDIFSKRALVGEHTDQ